MRWREHLGRARIEVDAATRERHLDTIDRVLGEARSHRTRPGRILAVAVSLVLLLPVVAFAAERSAPGDLLYPVRQAMERVNIRLPELDSASFDSQLDEGSGSSGTIPTTDQRPNPTTTTEPERDGEGHRSPTTSTTVPGRTETTLPRPPPTLPPTTTTIPERPPPTRPG